MTFDGQDHRDSAFVYPLEYHPWSPMTGEVLAKALQSAYYQARYGNRLVLQQSYEASHLNPSRRNTAGGGVILATSYTKISEGYAYMPPGVTHLRANVLYGIAPFIAPTVRHRLTAYDGTLTVQAEAEPFHVSQARISNMGVSWDPAGVLSGDRQFEAEIVLDVSTLTAGIDWLVTLEGYAQYDGNNSAQVYRPFYAGVQWEIVG